VNPHLELTIVGPEAEAPVFPDPDDFQVEVWRDRSGAICAYGYVGRGQHWLHFPGLAIYRFGGGSSGVTATAVAPVREAAIRDSFRRAVLPLALQVLGLEVLHASAIVSATGVMGLCAASGSGKSTIAYGLSRRGYRLWADDAVAFESVSSRVRAIGLPFKLRLRPDVAAAFLVEDQVSTPTIVADESAPLVALGVLRRDAALPEDVVIEPLVSSAAFRALLAHAYCFSMRDVERKRLMMERYLGLSARVPVFEIRFRPGLDVLPAILDRIEQAIIGVAGREAA
jgi:hypothetical protein